MERKYSARELDDEKDSTGSTEFEHRIRAQNLVYGCMYMYGCLRALKGFFLYKYTKKVDILSFLLYKNRQVYGHLNPQQTFES